MQPAPRMTQKKGKPLNPLWSLNPLKRRIIQHSMINSSKPQFSRWRWTAILNLT